MRKDSCEMFPVFPSLSFQVFSVNLVGCLKKKFTALTLIKPSRLEFEGICLGKTIKKSLKIRFIV